MNYSTVNSSCTLKHQKIVYHHWGMKSKAKNVISLKNHFLFPFPVVFLCFIVEELMKFAIKGDNNS